MMRERDLSLSAERAARTLLEVCAGLEGRKALDLMDAALVGKLHANFVAMDANKSGALEQNEFANLELIKKAGTKAPMLSAFDTDRSGKLEFKEYVELISSLMKNK